MRRALLALVAGVASAFAATAGVAWYRARTPKAGDDLAELTRDELYERARAADIPGRSDMNKDEFIRALRSSN